MSVFDEAVGIKGAINHLLRYRERMYVGTLNGLYFLDGLRATAVSGINASCFYLAEVNGSLLAATSNGVYRVSGSSAQSLSSDFALCLHPLRTNPKVVFVGLENGLGILDLARNSYRRVTGIDDQIAGISEDDDGHIWLETLSKGLYRTDAQATERKLYTIKNGLTTLLYNKIVNSPQGLIAWNKDGTFRYDAAADIFKPYNLFQPDSTAANDWKGSIVPDNNGNIWTTRGDDRFITFYKKNQKKYQPITQSFRAFSDRSFDVIYPDSDSLVWFGGPEGAIRFDLAQSDDYLKSYPALIRKINLKADTLAFNGYRNGDVTLKNAVSNPERMLIDYALNDISFVFSATSFNAGEVLVFKYILENYDNLWSD